MVQCSHIFYFINKMNMVRSKYQRISKPDILRGFFQGISSTEGTICIAVNAVYSCLKIRNSVRFAELQFKQIRLFLHRRQRNPLLCLSLHLQFLRIEARPLRLLLQSSKSPEESRFSLLRLLLSHLFFFAG